MLGPGTNTKRIAGSRHTASSTDPAGPAIQFKILVDLAFGSCSTWLNATRPNKLAATASRHAARLTRSTTSCMMCEHKDPTVTK